MKVTVRTSELTGPALRYAVAFAQDWNGARTHSNLAVMLEVQGYRPDLLWEQGGPVIEREGIALWLSSWSEKGWWAAADKRWMDLPADSEEFMVMPDPWHGPTPLVAAMRCVVGTEFGDEIKIPEELL